MSKLDLKKARRELFTAKRDRFERIHAQQVQYLMADGCGDPNTTLDYRYAVEALYSTAYAIKFSCKTKDADFVVAPLEGLWWADNPESFTARRKHEWSWTMMIMLPDFVGAAEFQSAKAKSESKLGRCTESLRLEALEEGLCLQALHIGSYDDEGPLLESLHHDIMPSKELEFAGRHHEVYLSDPRKTPADKLRTILRQPVKPISRRTA